MTLTLSHSRLHSLSALVLAFSLVTVGIVIAPAHAAKDKAAEDRKDKRPKDPREMQARQAYAAGNYKEALDSFREYLRKAKDMPADERSEVEGYIKEMEDLQRQNAAAAEAAKPAPQPLPVAPQPEPMQPAFVVQQPAPAPEPVPFYKKGWFWGVAGAVVVAGVVTGLAVGGVFSSKSRCPAGFTCTGNLSLIHI